MQKNRYVLWKLPFYYKGSSLNSAWNLTFCLFSFFGKKTTKKLDIPYKKTVTFYETSRSIIRGFPSISVWNLTFALFLSKKTTKKHEVLCRKIVTFCKNYRFLRLVILEVLYENWPLSFFWSKNNEKNTMYPAKTHYVLWKLSIFCRRFFLSFCLKSHLLPFFLKKQVKNTMYPAKNVTFSENCRLFAGGFSWKSVWSLTFCPFFGQKTTKKTWCTL